METVEAYSARKKEELDLLNSLLADPLTIRSPKLITEVIEQKFHLAAALKAEHVLHDWALTETAWTHSHRPVAIFGGTAQLVVAWLTEVTGNALAPSWYLLVATAAGLGAMILMPETSPLKRSGKDRVTQP